MNLGPTCLFHFNTLLVSEKLPMQELSERVEARSSTVATVIVIFLI